MNEYIKNSPKKNSLAIWSLLLGIISLFFLGLFTGIPAVIFGHIAYSRVKKSNGSEVGKGIAIAGFCIGYIGTILTTTLAVIGVLNFLSYRSIPICSHLELQTKKTASSLACYLSYPSNEKIPTIEELKNSVDCGFTLSDNVTIKISGVPEKIIITAYDKTKGCQLGSYYVISIPKSDLDGWRK